MFERYTGQARRVIFFARYEAVQRSSDKITTAHLLLGLVREKNSRADAVGSLSTKIPDPCELLGMQHRTGKEVPFNKKAGPSLNDNSKKVLAYAAQEAEMDQQRWIDTDHLLRGLLRFPNEATPALEFIPLDLDAVRSASRRHREEFPPAPDPRSTVAGTVFRTLKPALVKLAWIAAVGMLSALIIRWLNY
jgi:ATP-dependent Clp protease ATP-binding subunit ClpC